MKMYPKEKLRCFLDHVKDPKTFQGKVKAFISAFAHLKVDVVSDLFLLIIFVSHVYFLSLLLLL